MTELARGNVADRPWGRTLATLALRGVTGQLSLIADGKRYQIAFAGGAVVGAASPAASDAAVRVALTSNLVSSTQAAEIARRQAAAPQRDEIEVIAELLRLGPDHALRLRRRTIAQRAARTFSVDRGEFVIDDRVTVPVVPGTELDVRSVIYYGARQNLSDERLVSELAHLGHWFRLRPEVVPDLGQFGFTDAERPVLDLLHTGADLDALDGAGIELRAVRAIVYALASCNGCETDVATRTGTLPRLEPQPVAGGPGRRPGRPATATVPPPSPTIPPPVAGEAAAARPGQPAPRTGIGQPPGAAPPTGAGKPPAGARAGTGQPPPAAAASRTGAGQPPLPPIPPARGAAAQTPPSRTKPPQFQGSAQALPPAASFRKTESSPPADEVASRPRRPASSRPPTAARRRSVSAQTAAEVTSLIAQRLEMLARGADHYRLLGVSTEATPGEIRKAYFALARQLHPDRLSALAIADDNRDAQRLFAQVNTAFAVLSDPKRRADYTSVLRRGGEAAVRAEQQRAEQLAARIIEAEEAFHRAEAALRRDQLAAAQIELQRAIELNPDEADYAATLAWVQFCAAGDKQAIARTTRAALDRAIRQAPRAVAARFYLGRVERMVGRDQEALRLFREVLQIAPHHAEAASEARVIEARLASGTTGRPKR